MGKEIDGNHKSQPLIWPHEVGEPSARVNSANYGLQKLNTQLCARQRKTTVKRMGCVGCT
jgi:hypothetical protein